MDTLQRQTQHIQHVREMAEPMVAATQPAEAQQKETTELCALVHVQELRLLLLHTRVRGVVSTHALQEELTHRRRTR